MHTNRARGKVPCWRLKLPTVLQQFYGNPEEDEGVDQGIDAVTPENLQEDKPGDQSVGDSVWDLQQTKEQCEGSLCGLGTSARNILSLKLKKKIPIENKTKTVPSY